MGILDVFRKKEDSEEKLKTLTRIINDGHSDLIHRAIPFLKDDDEKVQEMACNTIIYLFKKNDSKKGYYDSLKYCNISVGDVDFYERKFNRDCFVELLAISSFNKNGYVREKAVEKLSKTKHPRAIQFLVYRLADWVKPVRDAALKGLESFWTKDYIGSLVENLPVFDWLQKVERIDLSETHKRIIDFTTNSNRDYVLTNYKKFSDKLRLILAKHISKSLSSDLRELKLFLKDKNYLIRNLIFEHFEKLTPSDIENLLNDKSGKVRLQTLYHLKNNPDFYSIIDKFIADDSATIRQFVRYYLKTTISDFAIIYYQNLIDNKRIIGSLSGLAEINAQNHSGIVINFLNNPKVKIRKAAFLALTKLDEKVAYNYGLMNLDIDIASFRNIIVDFLSKFPNNEVLTKTREQFKIGNPDMKKSMLRLFNNIEGWSIIPDLMLGTIDSDETIRNLSFGYVLLWKARAARLFTTPQREDIERARQIFSLANEILKDKNYFKINPLNELDYYFK